MTGEDLRFLVGVADVARTDYEPTSMSLARKGSDLVAYYRGAYAQGRRWRPAGDTVPDDLAVAVTAVQFKALCQVFRDQATVTIKHLTDSTIQLAGRDRGVNLSITGPADPETLVQAEVPDMLGRCRVNVDKLLAEVELANEFTAKSMAKPIYTGIHLSLTAGAIRLRAWDGLATFFESTIPADVMGEAEAAPPAYDLLLGLRLCHEGEVEIVITTKDVHLFGKQGDFRLQQLQGRWEAFDTLLAKHAGDYQAELKLEAAQVRAATSAASDLKASNDLELVAKGDRVALRTRSNSKGQFVIGLKQPVATPIECVYDVTALKSAAALGEFIVLRVPAGGLVTQIQDANDGHRKVWLQQRVIRQT